MVSKDGIRHYTAIKSLSRLLSSKNSNTKRKQHYCMNCLQDFTQESSRDQHQVYCENESVRVQMPKKGSTIEFKDGQNLSRIQTQTEESDCCLLQKSQRTAVFVESYFETADKKVKFYAGLLSYDILITRFNLVSLTRTSSKLAKF